MIKNFNYIDKIYIINIINKGDKKCFIKMK